MSCYFQGCKDKGITREHVPPKAFFPKGENNQLLTVKSCKLHNNKKAMDDFYVLAHICLNASPNNRAREVFETKILPQLDYNNEAFRKTLMKGSVQLEKGAVKYPVKTERFDDFFDALSFGIVFKVTGNSLPSNYMVRHIYSDLLYENLSPVDSKFVSIIEKNYSGEPESFLEFGKPGIHNERIYDVKLFGLPNYQSSITLVHRFFGKFKVISMLTNKL